MKNILFLFLSFLILSSCIDKGRDPLMDFTMGSNENDWEKVLNNLVDKGIFEEDEYGDFRSFIYDGKDSFQVEYNINKPYPLSNYNIYSNYELYQKGVLRNIVIKLKGDTICDFIGEWIDGKYLINADSVNKREILTYGPRKKSTVDKIRQHLIKLYGNPNISSDSIENQYKKDLLSGNLNNMFGMSNYSKFVNGHFENINFIDTWNSDSMTVQILREPYYFDSCFKDTVYPNAHIVYKMIGFNREFDKRQEEIRNSFKPNDLITISFNQPIIKFLKTDYEYPYYEIGNPNKKYGQVYELFQPIGNISREGPEDRRPVTDIKFDIVYLNRFNEEIARIQNCLYDFKDGLDSGRGLLSSFGGSGYTINYYANLEEGTDYEYLRKNIDDYKYDGKGKIIADIKKVVFKDGAILE